MYGRGSRRTAVFRPRRYGSFAFSNYGDDWNGENGDDQIQRHQKLSIIAVSIRQQANG